MIKVSPVLNISLLVLIAKHEGISLRELERMDVGCIHLERELQDLVDAFEVVEENGRYWTRNEYQKRKMKIDSE